MPKPIQDAPTILRRNQVQSRTGLPRSTLYDKIKSGEFPAPISLGVHSVGWLESEISAWIESCVQQSRAKRSAV